MLEKSSFIDEICGMLIGSPLFANFQPAEIRSVARYFSISKIEEGSVIFREGDAGTFLCIVNSGKISVLKANPSGENIEIASLANGRTFGEMAILDGERRSATCIAATDCTLLTLSKDALDNILNEEPRTAAKVIRAVAVALSRKLRITDGKLVDRRFNGAY